MYNTIETELNGNIYLSKSEFLSALKTYHPDEKYNEDYAPVKVILEAFVATDPRWKSTAYESGDSIYDLANAQWKTYTSSSMGFKKYMPDGLVIDKMSEYGLGNDGHYDMNFRIIRLGDILLQYAEALIYAGEYELARNNMNMVRRRGFGADIKTPHEEDITTNNPDSLLLFLKRERFVELCLEGSLFYDYVRWGDAADVLASEGYVEGKNHRLPIPYNATVANPLVEPNDGY
ncbi:MAG: RagB/SusD family nutrient uptake outer membrane protein [Bacteroidales bacterium]|nr:RagB/SusD family nutrient uptake outer membrane protein [Bacteroidales bacterium]